MNQSSVELTDAQRQALKQFLANGVAPARQSKHAPLVLQAHSRAGGPSWSDEQIQQAFGAGLYEVVDPQEARRLTEKVESHSTPKHGSW